MKGTFCKKNLPTFKGVIEVKHFLPGRIRLSIPSLKNNGKDPKEFLIDTPHSSGRGFLGDETPVHFWYRSMTKSFRAVPSARPRPDSCLGLIDYYHLPQALHSVVLAPYS